MLSVLVFLASLHVASCSCPAALDIVRDGECRGLYTSVSVPDDSATNEAITKCKEIQAQPVIIHNDEHQSYWMSQAATTSLSYYPIGIVCNTASKRWEWADGSAINYKPKSWYDPMLDQECQTGCSWGGNTADRWQIGCNAPTVFQQNIFCTTQLQQPVPSNEGCENFEDDSEDGVCYQVGPTAETFQDAQMMCKSFGADLASIHNSKENSFVRRLAVSKGKVDGVYLGAAVSGKDAPFGWIDGTAWDYDNYYPGFPMKGLGDCVVMDTDGTSGQWVNVDCSSKFSVACIRQQNDSGALQCTSGPWKEGDLIHSPGYPFDASIPCDYILSVDARKKVQVEILLLEANSCCDHLLLYDNYIGGSEVANLTGQINDKFYTTKSSNFMRVSWQPQGGVNVRGMLMTFKGV